MHFVTGGAFNGKNKWVKEYYQEDSLWLSAYQGETLLLDLYSVEFDLIIFTGLEQWIKSFCNEQDVDELRLQWSKQIDSWLQWEAEKPNRKMVLIGTDISKGIVPIEKEHRTWRDVTGWCYQDLVKKCERVDVIWYGINQKLK